jgi:hypothetical protein
MYRPQRKRKVKYDQQNLNQMTFQGKTRKKIIDKRTFTVIFGIHKLLP